MNFYSYSKSSLFDSVKKDKKRIISMAEKKWMWKLKKRHICPICHKHIEDFFDAEFDHKKAHTKGGKTTPANTLITHKQCNRMKGKKTLTQIKRHLGTHKTKIRKKVTKKKVKQNQGLFNMKLDLPRL